MSDYLKVWGFVGALPSIELPGHTSCFELRINGVSYILDAGSGFAACLRQVENLGAVFFSHFHLDHIMGLWACDMVLNPKDWQGVTFVAGVPKGFYASIAFDRLCHLPQTPASLEWAVVEHQLAPNYSHMMVHGQVWKDANVHAQFFYVVHGKTQSCTIRLTLPSGKVVVYATDVDAGASEKVLVQACQDADLLIIDCQFTNFLYESFPHPRPHSCPSTVTGVAIKAKVKHVLLTHPGDYQTNEDVEEIKNLVSEVLAKKGIIVSRCTQGMELKL